MDNYFASNLKHLRAIYDISQAELAKTIGVDQTAISKWEKGQREPSISAALAVAEFFRINIDSLASKDLRSL